MDKKEYIVKQFARTNKKNYENYILTRIWHKIDRTDLEPKTQQYISRPEKYALVDLYFPQLNIIIEVDESHHDIKSEVTVDEIRDQDLIEAINPKIYHVNIEELETIENINKRADDIAEVIKNAVMTKITDGTFVAWNYEYDHDPEKYIKAGRILLSDNASFKTIVDVAKCFGIDYKRYQRGGIKHPIDEDTLIWFPKLNRTEAEWHNEITKDGNTIFERNTNTDKNRLQIEVWINDQRNKRIVFASARDNINDNMYRFKGVYKLNSERTITEKMAVWERISDRVITINIR